MEPLIVQAEYPFKGGNNDELCFQKGDLITVTQREEGGWWEGTLNEKTGWFPSNYVNEYKAPLPPSVDVATRPPEEVQEYRSVVLKDLLDSERAHVAELQGLLENFLEPLQQTQILSPDEYAQLMCNFVEIVRTHEELLIQIEECNDRVGKLFLNRAPLMKQVHQAYCAAHPKAVVILDKHKDELDRYMERQGAASPGLLVLTTGLSKPFRRLDKYSAMLQELERHMESSHPDRGDTQRSVSVYKDIAATCSATRRQKELELQVLTGPVRGWQGQELSSLGDILHMGSVAVGPDHRDRYFVLFPQTLIILSVSQRMSAFIYEGKLPIAGISVQRLEDSDVLKNAFEITAPMERIVAVCQGPNEANKWVELLSCSSSISGVLSPSMPIGIKRQLSNLSNSSIGASAGGGGGSAPQLPAHMSPPVNIGMLTQRSSTQHQLTQQQQQQHQQQLQQQQQQPPPSVVVAAGMSSGPLSLPSQHKRSLSFNHHLSYNQFTHTQHPPPPPHHQGQHQSHHLGHLGQQQQQQQQLVHQQQQPQSLPCHPGVVAVPAVGPVPVANHKSNLIPTSNSISKVPTERVASMATSGRNVNIKANWCITNLRPAPPLRPCLLNASGHGSGNSSGGNTSSGGSGSGGGGGGGSSGGSGTASNPLASYCSSRKLQPTFEEDALVLRVFEAYCAAYQSTARNTIHSALQPWTPCLPIRGGKLKTSKPFSTSNPQLPLLCGPPSYSGGHNSIHHQQQQQQYNLTPQQQQQQQRQRSSNSLNSSFIWREASPNNFNLYSSSVSSLSGAYHYSLNAGTANSFIDYQRAMSEERATRKSLNRMKSGFGSGYDNICMSPLLPRKSKPTPQLVKHSGAPNFPSSTVRSSTPVRQYGGGSGPNITPQAAIMGSSSTMRPGLYDRRLNRSFETASSAHSRYAGYGGAYMMDCGGLKTNALRRSTPHLGAGDESGGDDTERDERDASSLLLRNNGSSRLYGANGSGSMTDGSKNAIAGGHNHGLQDNQRHSGSWCCGLENEDMTPTLRQLWTAIKQMQQDLSQMKLQINEERALRVSLQQLLMQHLETGSTTSSGPTPKC